MTASKRVELLKRVAQDGTKKKLSFEMCEKIAEDLDLTLEQVGSFGKSFVFWYCAKYYLVGYLRLLAVKFLRSHVHFGWKLTV